MKLIPNLIPSYRVNLVLALASAALLMAVVPSASAKTHSSKVSQQPAAVIAHIALPGAPTNEMLLQQQDGKDYLYLVRNSRKGFTVVDITHPSQPNLIKRVAWPDGASAGQLQLVSGELGLAEGSNSPSASARAGSPPETVEVLDLSDPANPTTVQKFSGVTSVLTDEGRHLIFLTNAEGLWIVRSRPEKHVLPACTSDDLTAAMPMCQ